MLTHALHDTLHRLKNAASTAQRPVPALLAVSKTRPAQDVAALAAAGQRAFGENYVQEALAKQAELRRADPRWADPSQANPAHLGLQWHLIGHLQSNKAKEAALAFDWIQSVDRPSLVAALDRHRPTEQSPLNVLIQVNVDDEASKHGCRPEDVPALASLIAQQPRLCLRGLMVIPTPHPDPQARRGAFRRTRALFDALCAQYPQVDTLSMGMSDDLEVAIEEGATLVRVGTALFGARPARR